MNCPECDGRMLAEIAEASTHRGTRVEAWAECEDCGHTSDEWGVASDAEEDYQEWMLGV